MTNLSQAVANGKYPVLAARQLRYGVRLSDQSQLTLLDGVDLEVEAGSAIAIMGESGSGKTTLLSQLAGFERPTGGEVEMFGTALSQLGEDDRARIRVGQVGFVFQSFHLMRGMTAVENVALPLELNGSARGVVAKAREALTRVGLGQRLGHFPAQLSGGEQQRVALARAFVTDPRLLFADEPTGNLDAATGARIMDLMFELREARRTTLVVVTHDSRLAERCDLRYVLRQGRLVGVE
ncbi:MAG: ABC transporter ATP-binding protein [Thiotrichales bacterium]